MSEKYKVRDQDGQYFITISVVEWIDVFTREGYKQIIVESLHYCQNEKGLEIYAWCIMSNHLHLIVGRKGKVKIEDIVRDFKKFTSVSLCKAIENNPRESRREWLLWMFRKKAEQSNKHQKYHFWQNDYHPVELSSTAMMQQKLDYIHDNPVKEGLVNESFHYRYSSAIDYSGGKGLINIEFAM